MTEEGKKELGKETYRFLRSILPAGIDVSVAKELLSEGNFAGARKTLQELLAQAAIAPDNVFEDDPERVAKRFAGGTLTYLDNLGTNTSGLVICTASFVEPRGNIPELFNAEPGTVGRFYSPRHGGYSAILIAAHKKDKTGVISIEEVTVGKDRLSKTATADLFKTEEQSGASLYRADGKLLLMPVSRPLSGYSVVREEKNGGVYFALRK